MSQLPSSLCTATTHEGSETCPVCEQVIPNDRLAQVKARHLEHQLQLEALQAVQIKSACDQLTRELRQESDATLAKLRQDAEAKEAAARVEERQRVAAETEAKISAANTATEAVRRQADDLRNQLNSTLAATTEKVTAALDAGRKEGAAALQPELAAARSAVQHAEEQARVSSQKEQGARAMVTQLTQDIATAREEGRKVADAELRSQLTMVSEEKQAALNGKAAAEQQIQVLREIQDKAVREGIQEARDALEKNHRDLLNAEQAKHFEEKQKFQGKLEDLQRQLDNKTALDLGEGAEVDLFEALHDAFPGDDIRRIPRGVAGADIRHLVRNNGKDCGLILYDSKNHKAWRNDFVTKLRDDQIAAKADHAILSTIAFPQGTRQLHIQDRVILVNPARAVVIAGIVRQQILSAHCLRLSNEDREEKALELYSFITSERFATLMTKLHVTTDSLNELDIKEQAAHRLVWQKRGQLIGSAAKAHADISSEVERIVGTAEDATDDDHMPLLAETAGTGA